MDKTQIAVTIIVALVSGGLTPFLTALLRRKPDVRQIDARTTSITIQGAEATVALLMKGLERSEHRERLLEEKLADRERKIEGLERRLDQMQATMDSLQDELNHAKRQLQDMHQGGNR